MNSGILWLPDFIMFMFTFNLKLICDTTKCYEPMKKSEIVINVMFFLIWSYHKCCEFSQYNEQIPPGWTFLLALLHISY